MSVHLDQLYHLAICISQFRTKKLRVSRQKEKIQFIGYSKWFLTILNIISTISQYSGITSTRVYGSGFQWIVQKDKCYG